ncbi:MAG TPA: invasion associated locus B family protein [Methyloceanibacter sp.]|nr:invasion associated locus B family protein [Methyloceanibacter sp.]
MKHRDVIVAAAKTAAPFAIAAVAAVTFSAQSLAQQTPAPKAQQPKATTPKGNQPNQPKSAQTPAQPQQSEQPNLTFTPWTKVCPKGQEANAKRICLTGKDGSIESGLPVVAAVLIEPEGDPKKILRITMPLGVALQPGTRVVIDQGQPMMGPYVICAGNGCMSDFEASGEFVDHMKRGKGLAVQGVNGGGQVITVVIPLADFAKAYDGPPTDPKVFEDQQRKRFEEFQKRQQSQNHSQ